MTDTTWAKNLIKIKRPVAMPLLPGRAPTYCSALSFISLDRIQTGQQTLDKDHKIDHQFLFGQKLRYTLLVIQLFVNFLAYYCNHTVIDSVSFDI